jgi:hypothetical protein
MFLLWCGFRYLKQKTVLPAGGVGGCTPAGRVRTARAAVDVAQTATHPGSIHTGRQSFFSGGNRNMFLL